MLWFPRHELPQEEREMSDYRLHEVFNEAAVPDVTFVAPSNFRFIVDSIDTDGKHVTLYGPSGCGKTTLVTRAIHDLGVPTSDLFVMNGRDYSDSRDARYLLSSALECERSWSAIEGLLSLVDLVVIDDFHYLSAPAREGLCGRLKLWHERGISAVIVGIAQSVEDLISQDPELTLRNDPYAIGQQDDEFIDLLIRLGEEALRIEFNPALREDIIGASSGVPAIAQMLCKTACVEAGIRKTRPSLEVVECSLDAVRDAVVRRFDPRFFGRVVGFAKGKQQARSVHNTYLDILSEIAKDNRSEIPVEHFRERIVKPIQDADERRRKSTSYYNCLNNLDDVIQTKGLSDAMRYDEISGTVYITDPTLRFYLNLLDIERVRQQMQLDKQAYEYDVAVSFAGEVRQFVEETVRQMQERGITVFYDEDMTVDMWGKDLQTYLAEVYAEKALYMVVFLSQDYP